MAKTKTTREKKWKMPSPEEFKARLEKAFYKGGHFDFEGTLESLSIEDHHYQEIVGGIMNMRFGERNQYITQYQGRMATLKIKTEKGKETLKIVNAEGIEKMKKGAPVRVYSGYNEYRRSRIPEPYLMVVDVTKKPFKDYRGEYSRH